MKMEIISDSQPIIRGEAIVAKTLSKFALLASAKIPLAISLTNTFRGHGTKRSPALYGGKTGTRPKDQCFFSLSFFAQFQGAEKVWTKLRGLDSNATAQ